MKKQLTISAIIILLLTQGLFTREKEISSDPIDCKADILKLSDSFYRIRFMCKNKTNALIFKGEEGAILIDPGYSLTAEKLNNFIKKKLKTTVKYIINTHHHGDHADANRYFSNAELINRSSLDKFTEKGIMQKIPNKLSNLSMNSWEMKFNGETITIIPAPGAHSQTDILIKFNKEKILLMGDLLLTECFPAVGRQGARYMEIMDNVLNNFKDTEWFIGGHGRELKRSGITSYVDMLKKSIVIVNKYRKKGWSYQKMQKKRILKDYEKYNHFLTWLNTDYWVSSVYRSFK